MPIRSFGTSICRWRTLRSVKKKSWWIRRCHWWRKLWVRAFVLQLKLSVPAHRYFGLQWDHPMLGGFAGIEHLSKTVVPVLVHRAGADILLPDRDKRM